MESARHEDANRNVAKKSCFLRSFYYIENVYELYLHYHHSSSPDNTLYGMFSSVIMSMTSYNSPNGLFFIFYVIYLVYEKSPQYNWSI